MAPGAEWLTTRDLRVTLLAAVEITAGELLTEEELQEIRRRVQGGFTAE